MSRMNPFHLVDNSPWPLMASLSGFFTMVNFLMFFYLKMMYLSFFFFLLTVSYFWWRDVYRESTLLSFHTKMVQNNILNSMIWFISSEVFFFFSFFWAFFHSSLSPSIDLFMTWPPVSVNVLNPLSVPMLNTVVLLSSGITVTWSHYSIFNKDREGGFLGLLYTIMLSFFFSFLQYMEYNESSFTMLDSVYSSCFFMSTSFHSLHVIISTCFLLVSLFRHMEGHFNNKHHVSLECSIWYWHFVDVVWIFLYLSIYWWSSY